MRDRKRAGMLFCTRCRIGVDETDGSRDRYPESDVVALAYEGKVLRRSEQW